MWRRAITLLASTLAPAAAMGVSWDLDPTFGNGGIALGELRAGDDYPVALARQADGRLLVVGLSGGNIVAARFNADGSADSSLADGGVEEVDLGFNEVPTAVALQDDGKILIAGWLDQPSLDEIFVLRLLSGGAIDTAFGSSGVVRTTIGGVDSQATAIAVQSEGAILVAGRAGVEAAVIRYLPDGSLDTGFGGDGIVTTPIGNYAGANGLAIQGDGKIIVASSVDFGSGPVQYDVAVSRYESDGSLDVGFGTGGTAVTDLGSNSDTASAVLVDGSGRVVVAGSTLVSGSYVMLVLRLLTDGDLDTSFDGDGIVTTAISSCAAAFSVAMQLDGKLVVGGESCTPSESVFTLARYAVDGTLDATFDGDGVLASDLDRGASRVVDLLVKPTGEILAATAVQMQADDDLAVAQFDGAGTLNASFAADGVASATVGASGEVSRAMALQSDGKFIVGGGAGNGAMLARFDEDGTLDPTFGRGGAVISGCGASSGCGINGVVIQGDGKIVAAGTRGALVDWHFVLLRYDTNGNPDPTFGGDGIVVGPSGTANALLLQPDGKLVAVGYAYTLGGPRVTVARFEDDGDPDPTFDGDGVVETDLGGASLIFGAALQVDGKIVVAGGQPGFSLARYDGDGSLDTSFGGDGVVFTPGPFSAFGVAVQNDGKIVAVGDAAIRYEVDGSVDTGFAGGIVTIAGFGIARAVVLQPDGKLLFVGGSATLARLNADGSRDASFGILGVARTDLGSGAEAWALARLPDGKAVVLARTDTYDIALIRHEMSSCGVAPVFPCRMAEKEKLIVKDSGDDDDRLSWKWLKGGATSLEELADPFANVGDEQPAYRLCVYGAGAPAAISVPPSSSLWRPVSDRGFKYKDEQALEDGAFKAVLRSGVAGKSKIIFQARGSQLPDLAPPFSPPVTVQLVNSKSRVCWESVFDPGEVETNQPGKFKGVGAP